MNLNLSMGVEHKFVFEVLTIYSSEMFALNYSVEVFCAHESNDIAFELYFAH